MRRYRFCAPPAQSKWHSGASRHPHRNSGRRPRSIRHSGFGGDNLELLLVGADGRVEKLRSLLTPYGQTRRNGKGAAQPQLLVAVVSGLPIEALKPAVLDKADRLFGVIIAETQQANNTVNAAVKYFELN